METILVVLALLDDSKLFAKEMTGHSLVFLSFIEIETANVSTVS